jgi:hypothetical protein
VSWVGPPGSIVYPTGGVGVPGSVCPQGWDEDFDRSQMSTQALIGRSSPANVPVLRYNLVALPDSTPPAGVLSTSPNQEAATRIYISKTGAAGNDNMIWLGYLNRHSSLTFTLPGNPSADPPVPDRSRGYELTADVIEHPAYYEVPVFWTEGTDHVPAGAVRLTLRIGAEVPKLYQDTYGVEHYGPLPFNRTDLISVDRDLFRKLADRILEVRGSNSVPRLEAVTIDARTGMKLRNMGLMSQAAPERPSRYLCCLKVGSRLIFHRQCFTTAVRHHISHDEWTLRITLDLAEWAGTL